jgi:hypothetical protein
MKGKKKTPGLALSCYGLDFDFILDCATAIYPFILETITRGSAVSYDGMKRFKVHPYPGTLGLIVFVVLVHCRRFAWSGCMLRPCHDRSETMKSPVGSQNVSMVLSLFGVRVANVRQDRLGSSASCG